ncbi:Glycerol-3-phosphate ABC transporter, periplasmic glycerol-3-phosphate-binding protein (TC 3.A.1.1.3) [Alloactinosynnema sp. L-07]|uniref:extracellular solute-binding protein n=1 Tax=Alloactinosynnema sp. L-07 TaxID=1653480 RepID=UPI00065F0536|nr:extracellular solute-binding protein [Alloactinosynnema sp. L-07]CRK59441.1 Glycerol-3-phosphate ABC transporter, periplasmic glycerol-3-phosphate-binding protein (TC 3.A.1.1.3) [Alloactinosynnema sp. L-07]
MAQAGDVVIECWFSTYPFPGFLEPLEKLAEEFTTAHPGVRVVVRGHSYEELPRIVAEAALRGRAPAIATYYSGASPVARDTLTAEGRPLFGSVERAIDGRAEILGEEVVSDDILAAPKGFYTIGGELVATPFTLTTKLMFSNTELLAAAGVAEVPRTWAEVEQASTALAEHVGHSIAWPVDGKFLQHAMAQQAAPVADQDNGRSGRARELYLAGADMLAFVDWWQRLHANGHYLHTGKQEDWEGTFGALIGRQVAMRFSSSFDGRYMVRAGAEAGFEVAVTPAPYNDDRPYAGNWIGGDAFWLADNLDPTTRDGALAFIQFLSAPRNVAAWHRGTGSTPFTRGAVRLLEDEGWFDAHPHHRVPADQLDRPATGPGGHAALIGDYHGIQLILMDAVQDILDHGIDPTDRFATAQRDAQALLDAYNRDAQTPGPKPEHCHRVRI